MERTSKKNNFGLTINLPSFIVIELQGEEVKSAPPPHPQSQETKKAGKGNAELSCSA